MQRIQKELPEWVSGHSERQALVMPKMEKIKALMKDKQWQEIDKVADEILAVLPPEKKN